MVMRTLDLGSWLDEPDSLCPVWDLPCAFCGAPVGLDTCAPVWVASGCAPASLLWPLEWVDADGAAVEWDWGAPWGSACTLADQLTEKGTTKARSSISGRRRRRIAAPELGYKTAFNIRWSLSRPKSHTKALGKPTSRVAIKHGTMSAMGQKPTSTHGVGMPALPLSADILSVGIS